MVTEGLVTGYQRWKWEFQTQILLYCRFSLYNFPFRPFQKSYRLKGGWCSVIKHFAAWTHLQCFRNESEWMANTKLWTVISHHLQWKRIHAHTLNFTGCITGGKTLKKRGKQLKWLEKPVSAGKHSQGHSLVLTHRMKSLGMRTW